MKRLKHANDIAIKEIIPVLLKLKENVAVLKSLTASMAKKIKPEKEEMVINKLGDMLNARLGIWNKIRDQVFSFLSDNYLIKYLDHWIKQIDSAEGLRKSYQDRKDFDENMRRMHEETGKKYKSSKIEPLYEYARDILEENLPRIEREIGILMRDLPKKHSGYSMAKTKYGKDQLDSQKFSTIIKSLSTSPDAALQYYASRIKKVGLKRTWELLKRYFLESEQTINKMLTVLGNPIDIKVFYHPGNPENSTSSNDAAAFADYSDNSINLTNAGLLDGSYLIDIVEHEVAHILDRYLGSASSKPEFGKLLEAIEFDPNAQPKYKSYIPYSKPAEAFADLLIHWSIGETSTNRRLIYDKTKQQLLNEYFTSLIDGTPFAVLDDHLDEYDENGNVKPEVQEIRNYERKTARLKKKV